MHLPLRTAAPHALDQPIPLRQPVQTVVALAHGAHEAAQGVDLVLARVAAAVVDFADGDLHRGVVLGFDDAVRRRAFAGDVAGLGWVGLTRGEGGRGGKEGSGGQGMDVQIDELAFVVFHRCWRLGVLGKRVFVVASSSNECNSAGGKRFGVCSSLSVLAQPYGHQTPRTDIRNGFSTFGMACVLQRKSH